ncbi:MAG: proliferating cell nuclear antigen (pcna) [Candidatus Micrarchaeota archaeon]|nr:proliferating cell nuclear antigen (pcna) [Candidatus Micrarchaeota archaeon]
MFNIQIDDARTWKSCVDAIVNLIEEGTLEISEDGVSLRAMDPSQIAMVGFRMPKSAFSEYKVESATKLGLNFENLSKILARTRGKEKLEMSLDENKLVLNFTSEAGSRNFKVPLVEMPPGTHKELKIEHDAEIVMRGGNFKEILRDAVLISSHISLKAEPGALVVEAHGDSTDFVVHEEAKGGGGIDKIDAKAEAKATFPLQYLDDISKACPDDERMTIKLKTNKPLKVEYKIGEAELSYFLAPRIETE